MYGVRTHRLSFRRRRRRWIRRLSVAALCAAAALCLGSLALSFEVGWKLTHPARMPLTNTPGSSGLPFRRVHFPAQGDGIRLSGWLIPAPSRTRAIVIEAHGYRENRMADQPALPTARALHHAGFAVLMFDFRGEGESDGSLVSVGVYEVRDLLGAVDWARAAGYRRIGVIGYSMGASTALEAAEQDHRIQAVVADSPFANLRTYLQQGMSKWTHLPNWPFTPEILWEMRVFEGLDARDADPLGGIASLQSRPVLLIAGGSDTTVPPANSRQLYRALRRDRQARLWTVAGAGHVGAFSREPRAYLRRVNGFFQQALR